MQSSTAQAKLRVPQWMWGGSPRRLLEHSRLRSRLAPGESNVWLVQTEENYLRKRMDLITVEHLVGPSVQRERFDSIISEGVPTQKVISDDVIRLVNKLGERATQTGDLADVLSHIKLSLTACPDEQLASLLRHYHSELTSITFSDKPNTKIFPNAGIHFIRRDSALLHRIRFASVWLRLEYDARLRTGDLTHLRNPETMKFPSASDLHSGMMIFDVYLSPLVASLSPFVWGVVCPKMIGNVILSLGRGIRGTRGEAAEVLQTITTMGAEKGVTAPDLAPTACTAALDWWIRSLNDLFAILTDFSLFTDGDGFYSPATHLHSLLSTEQLFRRVVSFQVAHRDTHARRVLLFTVLDTLQRLTCRPLETHCSFNFARKTLGALHSQMPKDVADVLLPGPERGVAALRSMQDGFFMGGNGVPIPDGRGGTKVLGLDEAVAQYIKVLRDATHGHGSNRESSVGKTNALLAQHDGKVPHDLGWLGVLYLLDLLSRPNALRNILGSRRT